MQIDEKIYNVPPAFTIDLGEIQEDEKEEEVIIAPKEQIKEEIEEESTEENVETVDDDDDDDPYREYSDAAKIAIEEIKDGTFELEEKLIPKDLDVSTLRRLYQKNNELKLQEEIERLSSDADEASKYVKFLLEGGDPEAVKNALQFKDLLKLDPEDEEDQKVLIAEELKLKNLPKDEIDDLLESIIDKGKGKQRALSALNAFRKAEDDTLKYYKEQQEEVQRYQQEQYQEYVSGIKGIIDKGNVGGITLSKKDQREVYDALFTPSEIVTIQGNDGKPIRTKVTKVQALQNELNNNREKIVAFALWLLKDGNFQFAKEQGKEEDHRNLAEVLSGSKPSKEVRKRENSLDNLVSALQKR